MPGHLQRSRKTHKKPRNDAQDSDDSDQHHPYRTTSRAANTSHADEYRQPPQSSFQRDRPYPYPDLDPSYGGHTQIQMNFFTVNNFHGAAPDTIPADDQITAANRIFEAWSQSGTPAPYAREAYEPEPVYEPDPNSNDRSCYPDIRLDKKNNCRYVVEETKPTWTEQNQERESANGSRFDNDDVTPVIEEPESEYGGDGSYISRSPHATHLPYSRPASEHSKRSESVVPRGRQTRRNLYGR